MGCPHKKIMSMIGTITFGRVDACDLCSAGNEDSPNLWVIKEVTKRGLRVRIFGIKISEGKNRQIVLIESGDEYLSVSDENEQLWKSMLASYKTL
jgi:hypothetical protein